MRRSLSKWITSAFVVSSLIAGRASVARGQAGAPAPKPTAAAPKTFPAKPVTPKQEAKADTPEATREERTEKAKALLAQGEAKLSEGDVPAALELFRASNASMRSPQALFRIAVCLDRIDKLAASDEAAAAFHRFLGLPPPDAMTDEKRIATERLAELAKATLKVTSFPTEVDLRIDGGAALKTPAEARVSPGVTSSPRLRRDTSPRRRSSRSARATCSSSRSCSKRCPLRFPCRCPRPTSIPILQRSIPE